MKTKLFFVALLTIFLLNCEDKKVKKEIKIVNTVPSNFQMYKTSEMAELMRTMLAKNKELRQQIINGEDIGDFNQAYLKVHTAQLTDSTDLDETYPAFANHFVEMQQEIFEVDESERKAQFNNAINACVSCHQDRCAGPIPRIKKLLIK